ncbi:MAG TPA: bifunctional 4-hydroxy-2-oxoglutarate aldolase/2-dehydro-3-deoxy-phosphogluconate aldolase [Candidatus Polarisedimenticolia bacterium]|nr:bifunctional 4-hydroxy-2-oxoglutarate aldolase/2-dehydro-3-deoxy-phosphogluconate aldolase [Candidatus Polarisedimenticolia bacterium]
MSADTLKALLDDGVALCFRFGPGQSIVEPARAALRGGLKVLEITLTTPGALEAIAALGREPGALVGGGTVLTAEDVRAVAKAGGRFGLSPVFDAGALAEAKRAGILYIPGAATPTEILAAHRAGAPVVKVFPSGPLGGPQFLRFVRGPLGHIPLLPTSGPTTANLAEYFDAGAVAVGIGPEVFPPGFTLEGVEQASRRVRQAVDAWRAGRARA